MARTSGDPHPDYVLLSSPRVGDIELSETYSALGSHQTMAADLTLGAAAGSNDGANPKFLGAIMGNVLGSNLTKSANYLGGLIGHYNLAGSLSSSYPAGAVLAGIGDGVTDCPGAMVAYIDGDASQTNCGAMFKVMSNNSTPLSGPDFGVDLQDAAHDGYLAVDSAFYKKSEMRLTEDVLIRVMAGAPVDGVAGTLAGDAGPGSLLIDVTNKFLYINTNTKASPTWTKVGVQA